MNNHQPTLIQRIKTWQLIALGLLLIVISLFIHHTPLTEILPKLLGEVGALFAVVGVLHWMYEHGLRQAMLKDFAQLAQLHLQTQQAGIVHYYNDSNQIDMTEATELGVKSKLFIVGVHYYEFFFQQQMDLFKQRCEAQQETIILLLDPEAAGVNYLTALDANVVQTEIAMKVNRIKRQLTDPKQIGSHSDYLKFYLHPGILRYSFIATDDYIWFSLFANSKGATNLPAFKIQADSSLYLFLKADIQRLVSQSK